MRSDIESRVLAKVKPTSATVEEVKKVAEELKQRLDSISEGRYRPLLVGSVPKETFLNNPDIDIFILFPQECTLQELKEVGLSVGDELLQDTVEKYAEHPYTHGKYKGYDVDIVPCFEVRDIEDMKSSVDRTPLHTEYILSHLEEGQKDEVILSKAFLKGIGAYSAESRVQGFSGYLCELLVLEYGGFVDVLKAASGWKFGETISKSADDHDFGEPLVLIDPVDPRRNVASALSEYNFYLFIYASRSYLEDASIKFFFPEKITIKDSNELKLEIKDRGTHLIDITIPCPDVVDDNLYPQVHKARRALYDCLARNDFSVLHQGDQVVDGSIHLMFELKNGTLPSIIKHEGPPIGNPHTESFENKYGSGIYIEDGRLMVDRTRKVKTAKEAVKEAISTLDLGSDLNHLFSNESEIFEGKNIAERYPDILSRFLDRRLSWKR